MVTPPLVEVLFTGARRRLQQVVLAVIVVSAAVTAGLLGSGHHRALFCADPNNPRSELPWLGPSHRILDDGGAIVALVALAAIVGLTVVAARRWLAGGLAASTLALVAYAVVRVAMDRPHGHHPTFGDPSLGQPLAILGWALLGMLVLAPVLAVLERRARRRGVGAVPLATVA